MTKNTNANLGFEKELWTSANKMRNHVSSSDYCKVVQLISKKRISPCRNASNE